MDVATQRRKIERRWTALEIIGFVLTPPMMLTLFDLCCRAASFDGIFFTWASTSTLIVVAAISTAGYAAACLGVSACAELTDRRP